jgi:hypothetical protein
LKFSDDGNEFDFDLYKISSDSPVNSQKQMRKKTAIVLLLILAIGVLCSLLIFALIRSGNGGPRGSSLDFGGGQKKEMHFTEAGVLKSINVDLMRTKSSDEESMVDGLCLYLYAYADAGAPVKTEKVVRSMLIIPEFDSFNNLHPNNAYDVTVAKIAVLGKWKDLPGIHDSIVGFLNHPSSRVQVAAASTLFNWGEVDSALPVICRNRAFSIFSQRKDEHLIPLLNKVAENGCWEGRMVAATILRNTYGDSKIYGQVALDIILNAPLNTDDESITRAKFMALRDEASINLVKALPGLIRLAQDSSLGVSTGAVRYIIDLSGEGNHDAIQALIDLKDHHRDQTIREQAKQGLIGIAVNHN